MEKTIVRRKFIAEAFIASAGLAFLPSIAKGMLSSDKELFKISLGQWSLNRSIKAGKLNSLEFPSVAKKTYGIDAVEYVNQLFMDKANDRSYLSELKKRADDNGVKSLLIMVDQEGDLGNPDKKKREEAIENHYKWVEAAKFLGCHSIRVNAYSEGSYQEQLKYCAEGLTKLIAFSDDKNIDIIVENHGGMSSRGDWLAELMKKVDHPRIGTMPDFDNFLFSEGNRYDRYKGMKEIMPWAKSVSTKAHDFDAKGNETTIDFKRMFEIVLASGYHGYVSAEYEGKRLSEDEGIKATIKLMEKVRKELAG